MQDDDRHDRDLGERLRDAAPPAPFDGEAVGARIEASIAAAHSANHITSSRRRRLQVWITQAAAALALMLGGVWFGRRTAVQTAVPSHGLSRFTDAVPPAQVPLAIQGAGTDFVASMALLGEMRDRLTPEQGEQARQVALAVLLGAIAELAAAEDGRLPTGLLRTVLSHGVSPGGPDGPVVRYQ